MSQVIPDDTRDRAEALLLLSQAVIVQRGDGGDSLVRGIVVNEAWEIGTGHLRAALTVRV